MTVPSHDTFGALALPRAPVITRVLLPLEDASDPEVTISWAALGGAANAPLEAGISWDEYLGWGRGDGSFDSRWRPSQGRAPRRVIDAVMSMLERTTGRASGWTFEPFPEVGPPVRPLPSGPNVTLTAFASRWLDGPLPGSLRLDDKALLTAQPYADSLIISGPKTLISCGREHNLEIFQVASSRPLPVMQW